MSEIIYSYGKGFVLIESNVIKILNGWRQFRGQPEAGGILIGFRRPPHIHIIACTTPYSKDKRSNFGFSRRDPKHARIARKYWKETNGEAYYLGDWHTHPVAIPTPSSVDRNGWKKLNQRCVENNLVFIIVGRSEWHVQMNTVKLNMCIEEDNFH